MILPVAASADDEYLARKEHQSTQKEVSPVTSSAHPPWKSERSFVELFARPISISLGMVKTLIETVLLFVGCGCHRYWSRHFLDTKRNIEESPSSLAPKSHRRGCLPRPDVCCCVLLLRVGGGLEKRRKRFKIRSPHRQAPPRQSIA